ncbi:EscU/YscU/HrcU family type III secretion system export apparatus switch protein [Nocardioides sp. AE5]|uniref:EscU/YscU/HrcU family type III secretion system export apparatus switch protein n=1 Tax=Nocardioides sp. AE5 TaxID=2962573 RepID=UPI002882B608|nr:EscU/YscU/HrcU family type III secretion system export apparatus switch protein [Nocardioides sp. AE5]MDT0200784.1 EscU/YscU/HrcU family type III secretion system export apparatus switch protein [Nocardioides sp. AE5]
MSASSGEEKTEKPTPKKNKENRKEGQVPRTQEIGGWASMMVVALALPALLKREFEALHGLFVTSLRAGEHADVAIALKVLGQGMWHAFLVLVVLGAAVMLLGVGAALSQGGFYLATKAMKPKLSKLDPIKGAKRIFGPQAWWEGGKMLIKSALVAILVYAAMRALMPMLGGFIPIPSMLEIVGQNALSMIRNIALAGLVMGGVDYLITRRRIGKQTRMTKTEVKQEHKQSEGDPMLKGARRSRQLAVSRNRMLADVSNADVVLVNPTHVAVALSYDAEKGAPRVVARGAGVIAAKIRERAAESDVPLVRDIPLARALHSSTEVGQEIPAELFAAVAQVLAFVISRRSRGQLGGAHRSPRSESELPAVPAIGRRRRTPTRANPAPAPA